MPPTSRLTRDYVHFLEQRAGDGILGRAEAILRRAEEERAVDELLTRARVNEIRTSIALHRARERRGEVVDEREAPGYG